MLFLFMHKFKKCIKNLLIALIVSFSIVNVVKAVNIFYNIKPDLTIYASYHNAESVRRNYGKNGLLSIEQLSKIKSIFPNIIDFQNAGYNLKEAAKIYKASDILFAYGDHKNKLNETQLNEIKVALNNSIQRFKEQGYSISQAKILYDFTEIFKTYEAQDVRNEYLNNGQNKIKLLCQIRTAFEDNLWEFYEKGYTLSEARIAGFTQNKISSFRAHQNDFNVYDYSNFKKHLQLYLSLSSRNNIINNNLYKTHQIKWRNNDIDISDDELFNKIENLRLNSNKQDDVMKDFKKYLKSKWWFLNDIRYNELSDEQKLMLKCEIVTLEELIQENNLTQDIKNKIKEIRNTISDTNGACEGRLAAIILEVGNYLDEIEQLKQDPNEITPDSIISQFLTQYRKQIFKVVVESYTNNNIGSKEVLNDVHKRLKISNTFANLFDVDTVSSLEMGTFKDKYIGKEIDILKLFDKAFKHVSISDLLENFGYKWKQHLLNIIKGEQISVDDYCKAVGIAKEDLKNRFEKEIVIFVLNEMNQENFNNVEFEEYLSLGVTAQDNDYFEKSSPPKVTGFEQNEYEEYKKLNNAQRKESNLHEKYCKRYNYDRYQELKKYDDYIFSDDETESAKGLISTVKKWINNELKISLNDVFYISDTVDEETLYPMRDFFKEYTTQSTINEQIKMFMPIYLKNNYELDISFPKV